MFLWVRLVAEELRQCYNDADLLEGAKSLPKGLEKAYVQTLEGYYDHLSYFMIVMTASSTASWASKAPHIQPPRQFEF
jgi:hypothetical protein